MRVRKRDGVAGAVPTGVSLPYPKTCALSTSTSRLGSPKNAAIRPDTWWNGRSRAAPFSFQFAIVVVD